MIYSPHEKVLREELNELYARFRRNIEAMGSEEELASKYPIQYNKAKKKMKQLEKDYLLFCLKGLWCEKLTQSEIIDLFLKKMPIIKTSFAEHDTDKVYLILKDFIKELILNYQARVFIESSEFDFPYDPEYEEYLVHNRMYR